MTPALEEALRLLRLAHRGRTTLMLLARIPEAPMASLGFHAQQALEKALKAATVSRGTKPGGPATWLPWPRSCLTTSVSHPSRWMRFGNSTPLPWSTATTTRSCCLTKGCYPWAGCRSGSIPTSFFNGRRLWACGRRRRRWATQPRSGALSTGAAGAPQAHRPHIHSLSAAHPSRKAAGSRSRSGLAWVGAALGPCEWAAVFAICGHGLLQSGHCS